MGLMLASLGVSACVGWFGVGSLANVDEELVKVACRSNLHDGELATLEICERKLMATEFTDRWRTIDWREDLETAFAEAAKTSKPVFVFFYVKEYSQDSSPFT